MPRVRLPAAAAVVAALLAVPAGADAARPWGAVETVSRVPGAARAVVDRDGLVVLAWGSGNRVYAARRTARRGFGEPFLLRAQDRALGLQDVALDDDGDALVVLRRLLGANHRVESLTIRRGGSRTRPISLSGAGSSAYDARFAAVAPGTVAAEPVAAWWRREADRAQLARATGGRLLVSANATIRNAPGAAYGQRPDGRLVAVSTDERRVVLQDATVDDDFGPPVTLVSGRGPFRDADVAVGPGGTLAVAWREFDGRTYRARAAVLAAGAQAFTPPETISRDDERAAAVQAVVTADGAVAVGYLATAPGDDRQGRDGRVRLAALGAAPRTLTAGSATATAFALEADGRGDVTVAWEREEPGLGGAVFARALNPTGRLGGRHRLTRPGEDGRALDLAVGPRGDAIASWISGGPGRLRAVRRPATGS